MAIVERVAKHRLANQPNNGIKKGRAGQCVLSKLGKTWGQVLNHQFSWENGLSLLLTLAAAEGGL
jgi:hypothetical protein